MEKFVWSKNYSFKGVSLRSCTYLFRMVKRSGATIIWEYYKRGEEQQITAKALKNSSGEYEISQFMFRGEKIVLDSRNGFSRGFQIRKAPGTDSMSIENYQTNVDGVWVNHNEVQGFEAYLDKINS